MLLEAYSLRRMTGKCPRESEIGHLIFNGVLAALQVSGTNSPRGMHSASSSDVEELVSNNTGPSDTHRSSPAREPLVGPQPDLADTDLLFTSLHRGRLRGKSRWKTREDKWNFLQQFYSDDYQQLLREEAESYAQGLEDEIDKSSDLTHFGGVSWTSTEKRNLFNVLGKKGRFDLPAISVAVGSKSVIEIQTYLQKVRDSIWHLQCFAPHDASIVFAKIPAAVEIGTDTESTLERAADALCMYQEHYESTAGRKAHGDFWLTDSETAQKYESEIDPEPDFENREPQLFPARFLFNLPTFFKLSENIFMNQSHPTNEQNWRNLAVSGERPAATHDCLADLYNIVVSLTRRLVQTAIFVTRARLRAYRHERRTPANFVKYQDAVTAVDVLKLKRDSFKYWRTAPRRCGISVANVYHGRGFVKRPMTYNEAEIALGEPIAKRRRSDRTSSASEDETSSAEAIRGENDDSVDAGDGLLKHEEGYSGSESSLPSSRRASSYPSATENDPNPKALDDENCKNLDTESIHSSVATEDDEFQMEDRCEAYAEQIDLAMSHTEDARLLGLLGYDSRSGTNSQSVIPLGEEQNSPPQCECRPADWKDTFSPRSMWEDYTKPVDTEFFTHPQEEQMHVKRRGNLTVNSDLSPLRSDTAETEGENLVGGSEMETERSMGSLDDEPHDGYYGYHPATSTDPNT